MDEMDNVKFSLAISPQSALSLPVDDKLISRLMVWRSRIFDINFTARVAPFNTDAHGIILSEQDAWLHFEYCLEVQKLTNIPVSAIFNNIYVDPTIDALNTFCDNFQKLYDQGLRSVTLPHSLWMQTGVLQKRFPDLRIKNTVLRKTRTAQDFINFASVGFDYINLDRLLWRDLDTLKEIKKAQQCFQKKTGKYVYTSILVGEGCQGDCPFFEEHYQYTLRMTEGVGGVSPESLHQPILKLPIILSGCHKNISVLSRTAPSPFMQDLAAACKYIDVIKLAGRHDKDVIMKHLTFIEDFVPHNQNDAVKAIADCYSPLSFTNHESGVFDKWRATIANCKYQCWKCDVCQKTQIDLMKLNQLESVHNA